MPGAAAVAREVDRAGLEARVLQRLEHRRRVRRDVLAAHAEDRVPDRLARSHRPHGGERGAVLDDPLLAAVVPDEVRDVVDVGEGARRDRREADRRQRGEHARPSPRPAGFGDRGEGGQASCGEPLLERLRRQPVDDDEDELPSVPARQLSPWRGFSDPRGASPRACSASTRRSAPRPRRGSRAAGSRRARPRREPPRAAPRTRAGAARGRRRRSATANAAIVHQGGRQREHECADARQHGERRPERGAQRRRQRRLRPRRRARRRRRAHTSRGLRPSPRILAARLRILARSTSAPSSRSGSSS